MDNLGFLTLLTKSLLENGIDYEVTLASEVTVELFDMATNTPIGVVKADSLEAGLATLMGKFVASSRDVKVYDKSNMLSIL